MRPVGYLVNTNKGVEGEPGHFYDYILARNGVFLRARSSLLEATVLVGDAEVRGLAALKERIELPHGKIPRWLYELAISILLTDYRRERYVAITWEGEYRLRLPSQEGETCGVTYDRLPATVVDIHSHGTMRAFFSSTDNADEQGLRLYMVVGRMDTLCPEIIMRVGVYGYFAPVWVEEIFG
jgi:PRTRC genetic system protein A